jgi:hypothetical protein
MVARGEVAHMSQETGKGQTEPRASHVQTCRAVLPAEEQLGGGAHHLGAPHRLECELGVHGLDTLYGERLRLDLLLDQIPNGAHRAGEAEGDVDMTPLVMHADVVDQTELDEVHPDLRVYNIPQLVLYALLGYHSLTSCRHPFSTLIVKPRRHLSTRSAGVACQQVSMLRLRFRLSAFQPVVLAEHLSLVVEFTS